MSASHLMTPRPWTVGPEAGLDLAMYLMDEQDIRHLPVTRGERLVGIVTDRELLDATGWSVERARERDADGQPRLVGDVMKRHVHSAAPEATPADLARLFRAHRIGSAPIVEYERLLGIVTKTDLLRAYVKGPWREPAPAVAVAMSRDLVTVDPQASVAEAFEVCVRRGIRHLPVVYREQLLGLVSDRDLRRLRGQERVGDLVLSAIARRRPSTTPPTTDLRTAADRLLTERIGCLPIVQDGRLVGIVTVGDVLDHLLQRTEGGTGSAAGCTQGQGCCGP